MVVITVPRSTPLDWIEAERDGGRVSESLWSRKACPLSYVIPRGARKQKKEEGKSKREIYGIRREIKGRSWRGNCGAHGEMDYRWKQKRIGREIHVGDYGWRLIVGSVG